MTVDDTEEPMFTIDNDEDEDASETGDDFNDEEKDEKGMIRSLK